MRDEIYDIMKENPGKRWTTTELAKILDTTIVAAWKGLVSLSKYENIQTKRNGNRTELLYWLGES